MNKRICGLLIASGYSRRMSGLKALLDIGGVSFITGITLKLSLVCEKVVVVLGHERDQIEAGLTKELNELMSSDSAILGAASRLALDKLEVIVNQNYSSGMFTSLQSGISKASEYSWALYHFVDQPAIPKSFYFDFAERAEQGCKWIQPVCGEQSGHPLLLSQSLYDAIKNADEGDNLRNILSSAREKRCAWSCDYPEVLEDIDTIEDYNNVKAGGYSLVDDLLG